MEKKKRSFFRDWFSEYRNVNWPTKSKVASSIWVVLVFVFFVSMFLGILDFGFAKIFNFIFGLK